MPKVIPVSIEDARSSLAGVFSSGNYEFTYPEKFTKSSSIKVQCKIHNYECFESYSRLIEGRRPCKFCSRKGLNTQDFIWLSQQIWSNRWDYSQTVFKKLNSSMKFICKEHGVFEQYGTNHLNGRVGCKECNGQKPIDLETLRKELYDCPLYDLSVTEQFSGNKSIITVRCVAHDELFKTDVRSIRKKVAGCILCKASGRQITYESFLHHAKALWNDRWDYSLIENVNSVKEKLPIICKEHQETFFQTADGHLQHKVGCLECIHEASLITVSEFKERIVKVHGSDKYNLSLVTELPNGIKTVVTLICLEHGKFNYRVDRLLLGLEGCLECRINGRSRGEDELADWIESITSEKIIRRDRSILRGKELDIWIPEKSVAVEYNGLYWHSEGFVGKDHHAAKTAVTRRLGIHLIHVWEDDWIYRKNAVKSYIRSVLDDRNFSNLALNEYSVSFTGGSEAKEFFFEYSLYDFKAADIFIGIKDSNGELIAVGSYAKESNQEYSLIQFSTVNEFADCSERWLAELRIPDLGQ